VDKAKLWLWVGGTIASLAVAAPAGAAVMNASFGVSVTVVAACRIVPGQAKACAPAPTAAVIQAPQPVVRYSLDAKTGTTIETIEF
jgi:hypothetical protein